MAINVKPVAEATTKYAERARAGATEFAKGAEAAAELWQQNTSAATANFKLAITAPGIETRFNRGVIKAGAAKFARKIRDVAKDRYAPGVDAGKADYQSNVEPFFNTIAAITLPARKPRGDPANYQRSTAIGNALNAKRLAMLSASS